MDMQALRSVDQTEIEMVRDGEPTGWFVTLAGPGHPKAMALADALGKRALRREAQIEAASVNGRKYKPPEVDIEERRRENVANVVARIVDWRGLTDNGADLKFTEDAGIRVLGDPALGWAYGQIVEYLADERSFTKRSATG